MNERRDPDALQALESRRAESTRAILLAPLLALLLQPFLLIALGNENVGWLARLAVLAAAWGALLAAIWTMLRSRAREAQFEAELEAAGIEGLRPEALPRPRHHEPPEPPPPAPGVTGLTPPPPREPVTPKLEAALAPAADGDPVPETGEESLPPETGEEQLPGESPLPDPPPTSSSEAGELPLPEGTEGEAETEVFAAESETELIEEPGAEPRPAAEIEEGEPQEQQPQADEPRQKRRGGRPKREREPWVRRWDHHVVWWASGPEHARPYMAWALALGLFAVADLAVFLATI